MKWGPMGVKLRRAGVPPEAADALKCGPYEGAKAREAGSDRNI